MENHKSAVEYQELTLIISANQCKRCQFLAKKRGIKSAMLLIGRGSVKNSLLNFLGIKEEKRELIKFVLPKEQAEELLHLVDAELHLSVPGHGIAYTTPVLAIDGLDGLNHARLKASEEEIFNPEEEKTMFKKVTVIVERGQSNEVMDIARAAGARGGTILHGRGGGSEIATTLFGMELDEEKELVIILTPDDLLEAIVEALDDALQLQEKGKGILYVQPLIETRGLYETHHA